MTKTIEIKLVPTNVYTRWPCHVCGGCTEKVGVLAESEDGTRVCERCLKAGNVDERLEAFAQALENEARLTRGLIGRLKVPTYQQWRDACDAEEDEVAAGYRAYGGLE
jgi:hypothetical protein